MINLKSIFFGGFFTLILIGCSDPEPVDIDAAAANVGLAPEDYTVHENGAIQVHSKVDDVSSFNPGDPVATHGDNWTYVINNALQVADAYAVKNNPSATYTPQGSDISLIEQRGGPFEGEHLLTVVNDNRDDISYVQLRPLFDVNKSSDLLEKQLDEETPLWEVTVAKYNGREF